jgi:hypothetical protein
MRPTTKVYFNGGKVVNCHSIKGRGAGAVLLNKGGGGAGSSYSSLDDYIQTTGLNPLQPIQPKGKGLGKMNDKLENLLIKTNKGKKEKNITFSI